MVTPPITALLLSLHHLGMTKQSNWSVNSLCADVSYFLCCFVSFSMSSIGDGNARLHAGYGIKTQSGGARASNRSSVVFAVLFKIYETKLCTVFTYLQNVIIFIFTMVFTCTCTCKQALLINEPSK